MNTRIVSMIQLNQNVNITILDRYNGIGVLE